MRAREYLEVFKLTCEFSIWDGEEADPKVEHEHVCGERAVGVYVSADRRHGWDASLSFEERGA